jgi:hypothetical protein
MLLALGNTDPVNKVSLERSIRGMRHMGAHLNHVSNILEGKIIDLLFVVR